MAPEIYLDVFIIEETYEKLQREIQARPEVKQREIQVELGSFF